MKDKIKELASISGIFNGMALFVVLCLYLESSWYGLGHSITYIFLFGYAFSSGVAIFFAVSLFFLVRLK